MVASRTQGQAPTIRAGVRAQSTYQGCTTGERRISAAATASPSRAGSVSRLAAAAQIAAPMATPAARPAPGEPARASSSGKSPGLKAQAS